MTAVTRALHDDDKTYFTRSEHAQPCPILPPPAPLNITTTNPVPLTTPTDRLTDRPAPHFAPSPTLPSSAPLPALDGRATRAGFRQ
jgi:hypothetical protein